MSIRVFVGEMMTGKIEHDLPVSTLSWTDTLNEAEQMQVGIRTDSKIARDLGLRNVTTKVKKFIGMSDGNRILAAGPIWKRSYSKNSKKVTISGAGMASYWDHRFIIPTLALTMPVSNFLVPDPTDNTKKIANPALTTSYSTWSLGTTAKKLVQQARQWAGGNVPIVFQDDEVGDSIRNYLGPELQNLGDILSGFSNVLQGPDINFKPEFTGNGQYVQWRMETGTAAQPMIFGRTRPTWDLKVGGSSLKDFTVSEDAEQMSSLAWATGGRVADVTLMSRAYDDYLVKLGYPLLESRDSSHSSVSIQGTLDGYANESVLFGRTPEEIWGFQVQSHMDPSIDQYAVGDFGNVAVGQDADDWVTPDTYKVRIVGLGGGDKSGRWTKVQTAPMVGAA